jgi:hypothetical protein
MEVMVEWSVQPEGVSVSDVVDGVGQGKEEEESRVVTVFSREVG